MYGLDHLDADTEGRLAQDALDRYAADCVKAARSARTVHNTKVDGLEVVLEDDKGTVLARYAWIYDALLGMARLK